MHRTLCTLFLALLVLGAWSSPAPAQPCVAVDLGFEPDTLSAGETSTLTASIENTGDEAALASLSLTLAYNEDSFGPVEAKIHLNAGQRLEVQVPIHAVPRLAPGTLTLTLEASAGDCTSQAAASLVIEQETQPDAAPLALGELGSAILAGFIQPVATESVSWGSLKTRYLSP